MQNHMKPKLEIEYLESDPSKIWVTANNSSFAGSMEEYLNESTLHILVEELEGFPLSGKSEVFFQVGSKESRFGFCSLRFYCFDSVGHTAVIVSLANGIASNESEYNRSIVTMKLQFEVLALNVFRESLVLGLKAGKGKSTLKGINACTQNI
jgi:hypothetical protein